MAELLRVMTANLRTHIVDATPDDPDHWPTRLPAIVEVLSRHCPTIVGTQELSRAQLDDLVAALPHYGVLGKGRDGGEAGEYSAILFDSRRLEPTDTAQYWLSETPEQVGSMSWGTSCTRIVTTATFNDRLGASFHLANTHFDHVSEDARRASAQLLASRLPTGPVVVTGDFNCGAESAEAWHTLVAAGLRDAWWESNSEAVDTFNGYGPVTASEPAERIDWIMVSNHFRVHGGRIVTDQPGGVHPSDHWPVVAELELV